MKSWFVYVKLTPLDKLFKFIIILLLHANSINIFLSFLLTELQFCVIDNVPWPREWNKTVSCPLLMIGLGLGMWLSSGQWTVRESLLLDSLASSLFLYKDKKWSNLTFLPALKMASLFEVLQREKCSGFTKCLSIAA